LSDKVVSVAGETPAIIHSVPQWFKWKPGSKPGLHIEAAKPLSDQAVSVLLFTQCFSGSNSISAQPRNTRREVIMANTAPFSIDEQALVAFTRALIRCQSWNPPGDEADAAKLVADQLRDFGLEAEAAFVEPGRYNVYGRLPGRGGGPGHLLLVGHLDTVPPGSQAWAHDPLGGTVVGGRIYGRGAADMKGGLAAIVFAAGALATSGFEPSSDLVIVGTVGEEVDCLGAKAAAKAGLLEGAGAMLIPEPSGLDLYTAHKGALWVRIETRGRAAHGSQPDLGVNAILHMQKTIDRIASADWDAPAHPLLGRPTLNVGTIEGGTKTNMVPDWCALTIDFRTLPEQSHAELLARLEGLLDELRAADETYAASLEVVTDMPAISTPVDHPFVEAARDVGRALWGRSMTPAGASYFTDASVLGPAAQTEIPILMLGPGEEAQSHQTDEWVSVEALAQAARFYAELAARWLGRGEGV
jgi:succinyl-diaminopimelate desuccinylase